MGSQKKELGQHWLQDQPTLNNLAESLIISDSDFVLEVGPGPGYLTAKLLKKSPKLLALELDPKLALNLKKSLPGHDNLQVLNADALQYSFHDLPKGFKLATNLPYYISGLFFRKLTTEINKPSLSVILVQKEVAERVAAKPGGSGRSALSALIQFWYGAELGEVVGPEKFNPPPKVKSQSVILSLRSDRQDNLEHSTLEFIQLEKICKILFLNKRKNIQNNIASTTRLDKDQIKYALSSYSIDCNLRAEQLTESQLLSISNILTKLSNDQDSK